MLHRACDKIIFFLPVILFHGIFDCGASNIPVHIGFSIYR